MILIDSRKGSGELKPYFAPYSVPVEVASASCSFSDFIFSDEPMVNLPFADFCFHGNGPDGACLIGVERKGLSDFIDSMRTDRLSGHQLPGLLDLYAYIYIVIEGVWRVGESGAIETLKFRRGAKPAWEAFYRGSRPVLFTELDHHVATLQHKRGITFSLTKDEKHTAAYIVSRYHWWNDKVWDQHRSDEAIYANYNPLSHAGGKRVSFTKRTVPNVEGMVAYIKGFDTLAYYIGKAYPTMEVLMQASVGQLASIEAEQRGKSGRKTVKLGPKRAENLWLALRSIV